MKKKTLFYGRNGPIFSISEFSYGAKITLKKSYLPKVEENLTENL